MTRSLPMRNIHLSMRLKHFRSGAKTLSLSIGHGHSLSLSLLDIDNLSPLLPPPSLPQPSPLLSHLPPHCHLLQSEIDRISAEIFAKCGIFNKFSTNSQNHKGKTHIACGEVALFGGLQGVKLLLANAA